MEKATAEFPLLYVAIGSSVAGFLLLLIILFLALHGYKKCSHARKKSKVGSEFEMMEQPSLFPISEIPSPVFENPVFVSR